MIVAERKPLEEIRKMMGGYARILVVGCGTCVTVCFAGGEREVATLASALRMAARKEGRGIEVAEATVERQCDPEFVEELRDTVHEVEAVLSMGCGAGVQTIAETLPGMPVYPALNTGFIGRTEEQGIWSERCAACGNCILHLTGGICPIARCSKSLLNGPCGGSKNGKCEINPELDCAWQLIHDRLKALGRLEELEEILPVKDWSVNRDGGPRRHVREDMRL
jgi:ferredoxin